MDRELTGICSRIDEINKEILDLLNEQTVLVRHVSEMNDRCGTDYFNPVREQGRLEDILCNNRGPLPEESVKDIFKTVFRALLFFEDNKDQKKLKISAESNSHFNEIESMFHLPRGNPVVIAGPCAIENVKHLEGVAAVLKKRGIKFLRGGAYKPRTSPYDFQGLKEDGLRILNEIGRKYDLITVAEIVDVRDIQNAVEYVDVIQIGARNMQNFTLLKEAGQSGKSVLLKRGISATIREFMYAAEYIAVQGNRNIILCERGIRTYETATRNTLDISGIVILKQETKLPVIVDLSHSLGRKDIVNAVARAVVAAGADGIMVEVHQHPEIALSDDKQQLNPAEFEMLLDALNINVL